MSFIQWLYFRLKSPLIRLIFYLVPLSRPHILEMLANVLIADPTHTTSASLEHHLVEYDCAEIVCKMLERIA